MGWHFLSVPGMILLTGIVLIGLLLLRRKVYVPVPERGILIGMQMVMISLAYPILLVTLDRKIRMDIPPLDRILARTFRDDVLRLGKYALIGLFATLFLPEPVGLAFVLLTILLTFLILWLWTTREDQKEEALHRLAMHIWKEARRNPGNAAEEVRRIGDIVQKALEERDLLTAGLYLPAFVQASIIAVPLLRQSKPPWTIMLPSRLQILIQTGLQQQIPEQIPELVTSLLSIPVELIRHAIDTKDRHLLHEGLEGLRFAFLGGMREVAEPLGLALPPLLRKAREQLGLTDELSRLLEAERIRLMALAIGGGEKEAFATLLKTFDPFFQARPDPEWWLCLNVALIVLRGDEEDFEEWYSLLRRGSPFKDLWDFRGVPVGGLPGPRVEELVRAAARIGALRETPGDVLSLLEEFSVWKRRSDSEPELGPQVIFGGPFPTARMDAVILFGCELDWLLRDFVKAIRSESPELLTMIQQTIDQWRQRPPRWIEPRRSCLEEWKRYLAEDP